MPFIRYDTEGLTSMKEAAVIVGLGYSHFWKLCRESELLNSPDMEVGHREYYSQEQLNEVIRQVADLRRKGVI